MIYNQIKENRDNYLLKKCDVEGTFDFYTFIVCLDALSENDFLEIYNDAESIKALIKNGEKIPLEYNQKIRKIFSLAFHEYTHFIDCTSTLWGINYLKKINKGYSCNSKTPGSESEYFHAKHLHDYIKNLRLPDYYTEKFPYDSRIRPWRYIESIGNRFSVHGEVSENPIIFIRFQNNNSEPIVRSPISTISTISLLECSAMAQEIICNIDHITTLPDAEKLVEIAIYSKQLEEYLYNEDITEYSVCAHLLSNSIFEKDIGVTFKSCATLTRLVLNTPHLIYRNIAQNFEFPSLFGESAEAKLFIDKIKIGLKNSEPGFLYYLICKVIQARNLSKKNPENYIEIALNNLGTSTSEIKKEADKEFLKILKELNESNFNHIKLISSIGHENYKKIKWDESRLNFKMLNLFPVFLGDSNVIDIIPSENNKLKGYSLDNLYDEMINGQFWVEKFVSACT